MVDLILKQWISNVLNFDIEHIFVGFNNNILLPKEDPFIVINNLQSIPLQKAFYSVKDAKINQLIGTNYQIDFYRSTTLAVQLFLLINSYVYPEWGNFIEYTAPRNLTNTDSTDRYISRYSMDLTVSHEIMTTKVQDMFQTVQLEFELIP